MNEEIKDAEFTETPVEVVVDQEMLDENPALAEAGVEIGAIGVEATEEEAAALNTEQTDAVVEEVAPVAEATSIAEQQAGAPTSEGNPYAPKPADGQPV